MLTQQKAAKKNSGEGRVALVTGANHGIGAAIARALAAGAAVALTYLREPALTPSAGSEFDGRPKSADAIVNAILQDGGQAAAKESRSCPIPPTSGRSSTGQNPRSVPSKS